MSRAPGSESRQHGDGFLFHPARTTGAAASAPGEGSERCSWSFGLAREGRGGYAYNEEAFRYFLGIERKRCRRSGRSLLLLLVHLPERHGPGGYLDRGVASKLFAGLSLCLRETDIIGWYRDRQVAGAILTELAEEHRPEIAHPIGQRVRAVLSERLSSDLACRLQVCAHQYPEPARVACNGGFDSASQPTGRP